MTVLARLSRHRSARVGGLFLLLIFGMAILAPVIAPEGYDDQDLMRRLKPPSSESLLGTDQIGRHLTSRIIWGARISLQIAFMATGLGLVVGTVLGLVAGFYGGAIDRFIMALMDILLAFPGILLALAVVAILGPGLYNVMIAVGISGIPRFARLVRGSTLSVREKEYIEAQRAVGSPDIRILMRHILPNIIGPIVVQATLRIGTSILQAAGVSFLGLGAQPPLPDWGGMVSEGRHLLRSEWWVAIFPGIAIMVTVFGFNLLGDGVRDALDPRVLISKKGQEPKEESAVATN
ncbi:MAG: ABC transporter permease [Bacillota bacterium]